MRPLQRLFVTIPSERVYNAWMELSLLISHTVHQLRVKWREFFFFFFLLIDLCEGGEWNSCQPLPSNMFVSFFFSLKYQYFFCVCMCRPTPPYFLSHLCMLLFYFIFSKAWTHTVSVVNGENLKDANSVCFCLVVSRHHQKEDTLHAMQVVVYYFYLPLKKKKDWKE